MFDRWLDQHMRDASLDDADVARAVDADATTVSRWRRGIKMPDRKYILALARLFRTSPQTILLLTDPQEFEALANDPARQQEYIETIAAVPEMREVAARLAKMSPKKRAAWILTLTDEGLTDERG